MPSVDTQVVVIETAEEVFEDDSNYELSTCLLKQSDLLPYSHPGIPSLLKTYQHSPVISRMCSIPSYQAAVLLTEYHLMQGDTGPLAPHLKHHLASQADSEFKSQPEECKPGDQETKNLKNFEKMIALQRVNRIMADKPWAVNKYHIEQLRLANLSLSEIVHAVLIMAHFHALSGITSTLNKLKKGDTERKMTRKENAIVKAKRKTTTKSDLEINLNLQEDLSNKSKDFSEERYFFGDRLSDISCERFWDNFGFSVLNCLDEKASYVLDNRFSCVRDLRKGNKNTSRNMQAVWGYSQQLLGFGPDDYDADMIEEVLDTQQKDMIYIACLEPGHIAEDNSNISEKDLSLLTLVTVQEARMQAEIIYALHAVTQFMNW